MLFDAHLNAASLGPRDLADLRFFGVSGALVPAGDAAVPPSAEGVRRAWERIAGPVLLRLRRAGLAAYAALAVHPRCIPRRGLEALLAELPELLGRPGVAAIGEVGLESGDAREVEVLHRQLELARDLRLPVLVHTPWKDKVRVTRRTLALLRESQLAPERVLVDHADGRTVRMIRACGYRAGISLSAGGHAAVDRAVEIISALGPEGWVLDSDAGEGGGDLLALPRAADRLGRAGLSEAVVRRVCGANALEWLGVDPRALEARRAPGRARARR